MILRPVALAFFSVLVIANLASCGNERPRQTPKLGMSREALDQSFKGIQKADLAWQIPSFEWANEGAWEVKFDQGGQVAEATWRLNEKSKSMTYASYIQILRSNSEDRGQGSNDTPTFDTYQTWKNAGERYVLNLSSDSSDLYFKMSLVANVLASTK